MDPSTSPYAPGSGAAPPELAGRTTEIEAFEGRLVRLESGLYAQPMALEGLRGMGKTVLLDELARKARERHWYTESSVSGDYSARGLMASGADHVIRALGTRGRVRERLKTLAESIKGRVSLTGPQVEVNGADLVRGHETGTSTREVIDLVLELGEALLDVDAPGFAFFFDEFQAYPPEELAIVVNCIQEVTRAQIPVSFTVAGLPSMHARISQDAPDFSERMFKWYELTRLSEAAARDALILPARRAAQVEYTRVAVQELLVSSGMYPFFIQVMGEAAWELADQQVIGAATARQASVSGLKTLDDGFFRERTDKTSRSERDSMAQLAAIRDGPYRRDECEPIFLERMIELGLMYELRDDEVDFTAPDFAAHLRRVHPTFGGG